MIDGDRSDIRARFLAALRQAPADTRGPVQLCRACLETLPVQRVGISVISGDKGHEFLSASDDVAERMEWAQIALGQGPAVDAFTLGGPVSTPDAAGPSSGWPLFAQEAEAAGIGPVHALPLQLGAIRVGVLSLYLEPAGELSNRDFADAVAVAVLITYLLLASGTTNELDPLDHWWVQPRSSREIHQATGMVVAQLGVNVRDAYARLQAYAFAQGRGLDDVAAEVVHGRLHIDPDTAGDQIPRP